MSVYTTKLSYVVQRADNCYTTTMKLIQYGSTAMCSKTGYNRLIVAMVILPIMLRPLFEVVYDRLEFILKHLETF